MPTTHKVLPGFGPQHCKTDRPTTKTPLLSKTKKIFKAWKRFKRFIAGQLDFQIVVFFFLVIVFQNKACYTFDSRF